MGASFAGCSSNEGGAPSDTTAPVVTESVTDAVLSDGSADDTVIESSGASEKPAGDVFELMNDTSNTDECKGFVETFKNKLTALYGDKVSPSDSAEFEGFTVSYSDGLSCSVGGAYSTNYIFLSEL